MKLADLQMLTHQDRVLVLVDEDLDRTLEPGEQASVLVIPEAHRRFSRTGTVLHVGCGRETRKGKFVPTSLRPGDKVMLPISCDDMHSYTYGDGRECRILHEGDVLGVIE